MKRSPRFLWVVGGAAASVAVVFMVVFMVAALAQFPLEVSVVVLAGAVGACWLVSREEGGGGGKDTDPLHRYKGER